MKIILLSLCAAGIGMTVLAFTSFQNASPGRTEAVPDLDSFSEAGVATSVLKGHARQLRAECADALRAALPATTPSFQAQASEWIARYQAELDQLKSILAEAQLEHELLILFKSSNRLDDFVSGYLALLANSPEQPVVWRWAPFALDTAHSRGRFEETWDALRHVSRFHSNPEVAGAIRDVLEKWAAEHDCAGLEGAP